MSSAQECDVLGFLMCIFANYGFPMSDYIFFTSEIVNLMSDWYNFKSDFLHP